MDPNGFEAAAWRRRFAPALLQATIFVHRPCNDEQTDDLQFEHAMNAQVCLIEDSERLEDGQRPAGEWIRELERLRYILRSAAAAQGARAPGETPP